jgi:hypothetical protein
MATAAASSPTLQSDQLSEKDKVLLNSLEQLLTAKDLVEYQSNLVEADPPLTDSKQ